jgi:outer membrane protein assembly factor BamB
LYVAGVHEGKVIVIGSRRVRALQLAATDAAGKPAWSQSVELPAAARVAGRGFITAGSYYLPLSNAQIAVIDLAKGELAGQLRSPDGRGLGNLIGYGNVVLSLGPLSIDCFEQRTALEASIRDRLAKNATDPVALRDSARRALHDGKLEQAADLLRQSQRAKNDPQTKRLLVACLTQLIEADAAKHRPLLDELGGLVERPFDRLAHLRLLADALRREGKPQEAMQTLLRLSDVLGERDVPAGEVTRSSAAAIAGALAELYRACTAEQRAAMDAAIERVLAPALTAESAQGLWQFLDHYGFHPLAAKARQELVARAMAAPPREAPSSPGGQAVRSHVPARHEALWLLGELEQSSDKAAVRWATAQKARLLAEAGQARDAAVAYRRLASEFADQLCLADKTGQQLLSDLPADSPVRRHLGAATTAWPAGEVTTETLAGAPTNRSLQSVPLQGAAPWTRKTSLYFNSTASKLLARDSLGQRLWELQLESPTVGLQRTVSRAVAVGHLLIVQTGDEVLALDVLRPEAPTILWRRALADGPLGRGSQQALAAALASPWGFEAAYAAQLAGLASTPQGRLGPVTNRYVCLEADEMLTAVHPLTGRTLWSRRVAVAGDLVFGDDDVLVCLGASDQASEKAPDKALVLRADDGETVGRTTLVPAANVLGTVGSQSIAWESRDGKQLLRVVDAQGKELRRLGDFQAGSKASMVADESVAVLQPDGDLAVLRVADGQADLRRKGLKLPNKLDRIHVLRQDDAYFVAISRPDDERERPWGYRVIPSQLTGDDSSRPAVNGSVYALSKTGEELWKDGPARIDACNWAIDQPADLPVLVFISDERGRGTQTRIKLVDKRTGRTVYDHRRPAPAETIEIQGDPERGAITMLMQGGRVTLKFGQPKEAAPPKSETPKK